MEDLLLIFVESGATHLLPFLILIVIIYALSGKTKEYDVAPAMGVIVKMTVGLFFVVLVHLSEFVLENQFMSFSVEEIYVEIAELLLFFFSFVFFFWGLREVKKIIRGS